MKLPVLLFTVTLANETTKVLRLHQNVIQSFDPRNTYILYWVSAFNVYLSLNSPSDGSGRTGTFCAVNIALERVKLDGTIDMFQSVRRLRTQRPLMVQTAVRRICVFLFSLLVASSVFHAAP